MEKSEFLKNIGYKKKRERIYISTMERKKVEIKVPIRQCDNFETNEFAIRGQRGLLCFFMKKPHFRF
jgi:hypothetical protein